MSTDEYVPHEDDVRAAWVGRLGTDTPLFTDEADAEFDRFLARVKRAAAREALDGLAEWHRAEEADHPYTEAWYAHLMAAKDAENFHDANYPEETP